MSGQRVMNQFSLAKTSRITVAVLVATTLMGGCGRTADPPGLQEVSPRPIVRDNGNRILFPPESPGLSLIHATPVTQTSVLISVIAPARVVASALADGTDGEKVVLFDSPDVTSLYSQYKQAKSNVEFTTKNLQRLREMFETHAATEKDLNQAEADAANARAAKSEYESKLRTAGFRPDELERMVPGTVWLICDLPEAQLNEVQKGEAVDVYFTTFPDKKFAGKEESLGEVVDPATRTVKIRVSMRNPGGKILPGMFAKVDFGDPVNDVILLPAAALVTVEGKDFVFLQQANGEFQRRQIVATNTADGRVVVRGGLETGDRVVVDGAMLLKGLSFGF